MYYYISTLINKNYLLKYRTMKKTLELIIRIIGVLLLIFSLLYINGNTILYSITAITMGIATLSAIIIFIYMITKKEPIYNNKETDLTEGFGNSILTLLYILAMITIWHGKSSCNWILYIFIGLACLSIIINIIRIMKKNK